MDRHSSPMENKMIVDQESASYHSAGHDPSMQVGERFGKRLRALRQERNFTQMQMAIDLGMNRSFLSDLERGRTSITLPFIERIATGFRISLSDLLKDI
jgi:DNA-binding XRE family transcriptional regulator